jgi:hypothetical protein
MGERLPLLLLLLALVALSAPALAGGDDAYVETVTLVTQPPVLALLNARARDLLLRQLASDAAWRVTRFAAGDSAAGALVAVKRQHVEGELPSEAQIAAGAPPRPPWRWTRNGFVTEIDGGMARQTRLLIRLDAPAGAGDPPWIDGAVASKAALDAATIPLRLFRSDGDVPLQESYLVLDGPDIAIEIFEADADPRRLFTAAAVAEARALLQAAAAQAASGSELDRSRLTPGSILAAERPTMRIDAEGEPGRLAVSGYVNPQAPGWLYLKLLDAATGAALQSAREQQDTVEYVGWSADPREQFYFDLPAQCRTPGRPGLLPARFELWFVAAGAERLLLSAEQPVTCASD